ncbi:MAG: hypothetical protein JWO95_3355 [Verrucomicrobiales bacterium]|nr:hypothetical protein [Verrucomicrobiales bacterium]
MTSLQKCIAVLFVALWVPLTAHCSLEKLPGFSFLHCPSDTPDTQCNDDACQTIESGSYRISADSAVIALPAVCVFWTMLADLSESFSLSANGSLGPVLRPFDLPKQWQFVFRTALPVRAPSLLS